MLCALDSVDESIRSPMTEPVIQMPVSEATASWQLQSGRSMQKLRESI